MRNKGTYVEHSPVQLPKRANSTELIFRILYANDKYYIANQSAKQNSHYYFQNREIKFRAHAFTHNSSNWPSPVMSRCTSLCGWLRKLIKICYLGTSGSRGACVVGGWEKRFMAICTSITVGTDGRMRCSVGIVTRGLVNTGCWPEFVEQVLRGDAAMFLTELWA